MNALKIPDLNLFRRRKNNRQTQLGAVQKQGLTLLQKTTNKQLLGDINAQLYLQNYQNSLKHFVSPTKYKKKAQQILKAGSQHEQLLLKAISFPKNTYRCSNYYCKELEAKRKCVCQVEHRILPLLRSKSNENKPGFQSLNNRHESNQIQQINISSPRTQQRIMQNLKNHLSIDRSVITVENMKPITKKQIENIEKNIHSGLKQKQLISQNYKFRQDLSQKQAQLHKIDLNLEDQKNQQLDLRDLIQAKDSYIAKSKQILSSLDRIIRLGEKRYES